MILDFQQGRKPIRSTPRRGDVVRFPAMPAGNPLGALTGAAVAVFAVFMVAVVVYLVLS